MQDTIISAEDGFMPLVYQGLKDGIKDKFKLSIAWLFIENLICYA